MKNGASADIQRSDVFVEVDPPSRDPGTGPRRSCALRLEGVVVVGVCVGLGAALLASSPRRAFAEEPPSGVAAEAPRRATEAVPPVGAPGSERVPGAEAASEKPGGVYLSWVRASGAAGCPDPVAMQAAVARRLGRDPFSGGPAPFSAPVQFLDAIIRHEAGGWNVVITLADAAGQPRDTRTLRSQASTCTSLAGAAAVAMAVLIDPSAALTPTAPAAPSTPSPVVAEESAPAAIGRPRVSAGALVARGLLPAATWGATLGVDVRWGRRLGAGLAASFFPEVRTPKPDPNFAFGLTYLSARLCAVLGGQGTRVWGTACAAGHAGILHATVYFPEATSPGERSFYALSIEPGLVLAVAGPLRLGLNAAGYFLPWPRDLVVLGRPPGKDVAFAQPRLALLAAATLGLAW